MKLTKTAPSQLQRWTDDATRVEPPPGRARACLAQVAGLFCLALAAGAIAPASAATITVNNASGGSVHGACTLLDAVISANNDSTAPGSTCTAGNGADTIVFKSNISRIVFSQPANFVFPDALLVTDELTIDGGAVVDSGVPRVTLSRDATAGTSDFRLLETVNHLTLKGLAIENFHTSLDGAFFCGGAIRVAVPDALLDISDSILRNNSTNGDYAIGGAVCGAAGTWRHVILTGNHTGGRAAHGGAVSAWGLLLSIDNSVIDSNAVNGDANGGGIYTDQDSGVYGKGFASLVATQITHNQALGSDSDGGGFYGSVEMLQTRIDYNKASRDGGGLYSTGALNSGDLSVRPSPPSLIKANSVGFNTAGRNGGGVFAGMYSDIPYLNLMSIHDNTAGGNGGGVHLAQSHDMKMESTTVSGNTSGGKGGGIYVDHAGTFTLERVTITGNKVPDGSSGSGLLWGGGGKTSFNPKLSSTILFGNTGGKDFATDDTDSTDKFTVDGANVIFGGVGGMLIVPPSTPCDPQLGPLADNGGDTLTHAVPAGSCALDKTIHTETGPDQRGSGYADFSGAGGDIGSIEAQPAAVAGTCGSAAGGLFDTAPPTAGLCANGNPGRVVDNTDTKTHVWTCGTQTICTALLGTKMVTSTPSTTGNGTVTPDQPINGGDGGLITFTPHAAVGYMLASYTYCGQTTPTTPDQQSVTLTPHDNCDVVFNFEPLPAPQNGACGSDNGKTLTATPTHLCDAGTPSVLGGGGPWQWSCQAVNISGSAVACAASGSVAVVVTHTVTANAGANGTITPSGAQTVNDGSALTFTLMPDNGYDVATVTGCGGHLSGNSYQTGAITADCTVSATFVAADAPVAGQCGSDNGMTLAAAPTNLCSAGTPSAVAGAGPWTWSCQGSNGGSNASCSAQKTSPSPTTTVLSLTPSPAMAGQGVTASVAVSLQPTFAAAAVVNGGTVTVSGAGRSCSATVTGGSATCVLVFTNAGSFNVTASYAGDASRAASSDTRSLIVNTASSGSGGVLPAPALDRWALCLMLLALIGMAARRQRQR